MQINEWHANVAIGEKVVYPELSYLICGLCFIVQNQLGRFRSERQYADYLKSLLREKELSISGVGSASALS